MLSSKESDFEFSPLARELVESEQLSIAEYETYRRLSIQKFRFRKRLSVVAPTWLMRDPVLSLDDFLEDFADPETRDSARRDFACIAGGSLRPFFKNSDLVAQNADTARACPINDGSGNVQAGAEITVDLSVLKPEQGALYVMTADLSVSGDATGVALVHFEQDSGRFVLDFSFRIIARGSRVDYEPVRNLARELRASGFRIATVGFDQFQSNDSYLILEKEGFLCEIVKYADSLMGCNTVHEMISNQKLLYGLCDTVLLGEAVELQLVNDKRIDHLRSGGVFNSKDVWDAVVNAIVILMKVVREQHGEFLQTEDVQVFDPSSLFEEIDLTADEKLMPEEERERKQIPNNGYALLIYAYCRFHLEKNSDSVTVAVGATRISDNVCIILEAKEFKKTPGGLADYIIKLVKEYEGTYFFSTRSGQKVEVFIPDEPFADKMRDILYEKDPNLDLTLSRFDMSHRVSIMAAQAKAREGKLIFNSKYDKKPTLRKAFRQLVAFPFVPSEYLLLALEGVSRESESVDFTVPKQTSRVIKSSVDMSGGW